MNQPTQEGGQAPLTITLAQVRAFSPGPGDADMGFALDELMEVCKPGSEDSPINLAAAVDAGLMLQPLCWILHHAAPRLLLAWAADCAAAALQEAKAAIKSWEKGRPADTRPRYAVVAGDGGLSMAKTGCSVRDAVAAVHVITAAVEEIPIDEGVIDSAINAAVHAAHSAAAVCAYYVALQRAKPRGYIYAFSAFAHSDAAGLIDVDGKEATWAKARMRAYLVGSLSPDMATTC